MLPALGLQAVYLSSGGMKIDTIISVRDLANDMDVRHYPQLIQI